MTRQSWLNVAGAVVLTVFVSSGPAPAVGRLQAAIPQADKAAKAAEAAIKASPDLVGSLAKELGSTPEQAAGAAGALFGIAKSSLKGSEFSQISKAVPGMDMLLKAAPAMGGMSKAMAGGAQATGLAAAGGAFSKLGLSPDMVSKAVPILTQFVTKSGGAEVGNLLAGVLK